MPNLAIELVPELKEAFAKLPQTYQKIDSDFIEKNSEAISIFKKTFDNGGGIHLIDLGEHQVICKAPSREVYNKIRTQIDKDDSIGSDMQLVGPCILYPDILVFNQWVEEGNLGYPANVATELLKIAKHVIPVTVKKL